VFNPCINTCLLGVVGLDFLFLLGLVRRGVVRELINRLAPRSVAICLLFFLVTRVAFNFEFGQQVLHPIRRRELACSLEFLGGHAAASAHRARLLLFFFLAQLCTNLCNDLFISLADVSGLGSIELGVIEVFVFLALAVSLARSCCLLSVYYFFA